MGFLDRRRQSVDDIKRKHHLLLTRYDEMEKIEKQRNVVPMVPSARNSYRHVIDSLLRKRSETPIDWQEGCKISFLPDTIDVETIFGFQIVLCGRDESRFICDGFISNETSETLLMLKSAEFSDYFFDVGANLAYYSLLFATASNGAVRCYSFEPVSDAFLRITRAVNVNHLESCVFPQRLAVGSETAELKIKINREGSGGSSLSDSFMNQNDDSGFSETVQTVSLDQFMRRHQTDPKFGVLKIDVEGFEDRVIDGAHRYLSSDRPPVILIETLPGGSSKSDRDKTVLSKLTGFGYEVFSIKPFQPNRVILHPAYRFGCLRRSKSGNYIAFHNHHAELKKWCLKPETDEFLISERRFKKIVLFQEECITSARVYANRLQDIQPEMKTDQND